MSRKETTAVQVARDPITLDDLDMDIVNELIDNSSATSTEMARKYSKPLSTIQRRRTRLESTILKKDYSIDSSYTNWRNGEFFLRIGKGRAREVAQETFDKYDKNITLVTLTSNHIGNMIAHVYFKNSSHMFSIMEEMKKMHYVDDVAYAEHIEKVSERKPKFVLEDLKK